jgi:hypothetical protein
MKYRRNSDANLRALEHTWRGNRADATALEAYNAARIRASLPPIGVPAFQLDWGYQAGIPDVETTAWGCRAILTDRGADIVYSSSHGAPEAVERLLAVLNSGLLGDVRTEVRRLLRAYRMRGDEAEEFVLGQAGNVIVLGNTNASHGYLYMTAFEIPELGADGLPYEAPAPKCEICKKNQVDFGDELCDKCHRRICGDCSGMNDCDTYDCDTCDVVTCSRCKSNLTCSASNCNNFICNTPSCLEDSPKCEMCPGGADEAYSLCASCGEENKMCSYCSDAKCSVCGDALFTEDGSNRTKTCENCDELMHFACRKQPCKCEVNEEDEEDEENEDEEDEDEEEEENDEENRRNPESYFDESELDDFDEDEDLELGGWAVVHDSGDLIADGFSSREEAKTWLKSAFQQNLLDDAVSAYHITETED